MTSSADLAFVPAALRGKVKVRPQPRHRNRWRDPSEPARGGCIRPRPSFGITSVSGRPYPLFEGRSLVATPSEPPSPRRTDPPADPHGAPDRCRWWKGGSRDEERRDREAVLMRLVLEEGYEDVRSVRVRGVRELGVLRGYPSDWRREAIQDLPLGIPLQGRGRTGAGGARPEPSIRELRAAVEAAARGVLGRWLVSRTHLRPTTADAYAVNIGRYICNDEYGIGGVPLRALTRPMIQAFYADLERKGRVRGDGPSLPRPCTTCT